MTYTLMIQETFNSVPHYREGMTLQQAYKIAQGAHHKAQIINEFGIIEYEF